MLIGRVRAFFFLATMSFIRLATRAAFSPRYHWAAPRLRNHLVPRAGFSAPAGLSRDVIQSRVLEVLKGFEKVDPAKVNLKLASIVGKLTSVPSCPLLLPLQTTWGLIVWMRLS